MSQLTKNISSWSLPDLIDLPAKAIVYYLLLDLLDKQQFGLLNLAMMVFSYHSLSQLGVVDWLMYELPKKYVLKQNMKTVLTESYFFSVINQFVLTLIIALIFCSYSNSSFFNIAVITYLIHTYFYNAFLHKTLFLRFQYKFEKLLKLRVFLILTRAMLEISSILYAGIYGFLLVQAVIFVIPVVFLSSDIKFGFTWSITTERYLSLAVSGMPFFAIALMSTIISNIDRWFIVYFYGLEWFATYAVGIFTVTAILVVPGKVLSICTQYLKEMFVSSDNIQLNIDRTFSINNLLVVVLFIGLSVSVLFDYIILQYVPKYKDLIPLINALMLSIILRFSAALSSNVLYLLDKRGIVAKIQMLMTGFYISLLAIIYYFELEMSLVVWGMNLVFLVQIFVCLIVMLAQREISISAEIFKFIVLLLIAASCYFSYDFTAIELPRTFYIGICILVFCFRFRSAWGNLNYISSRGFSKSENE
ncbi:hypothetical protein OAI36_00045 [Alphaproteobacteria bacterium]|nr:hypothetical protein [Alphaproteobacteria bacterium]